MGLLLIVGGFTVATAQKTARSFELRHITADPGANGVTDFKGETSVFSTEQRVDFLADYASYARSFFEDSDLDTKVVPEAQLEKALDEVKPQPQPEIRRRFPLNQWCWIGYKDGQHAEQEEAFARYDSLNGVEPRSGALYVTKDDAPLRWTFPSQSWRFRLEWRVKIPSDSQEVRFHVSDREKISAATVGFGPANRLIYYTANQERREGPQYVPGQWHTFKLEFDFAAKNRGQDLVRYNLYVDGEKVADYVPMQRVRTEGGVGYAQNFASIGQANTLTVKAPAGTAVDDLRGIGYHLTGRENYPYTMETFLDQSFESKPKINGWTSLQYADSLWHTGTLPIVHGSERNAGESLYLRKKIRIDSSFQKAYLNVETLDPSGAIFVNGHLVAQRGNRQPARVDVTDALEVGQNQLAVKVSPFYLTEDEGEVMPHTPLDFNVGWFAGRMSLDLAARTLVKEAFVHTASIGNPAKLKTRLTIENQDWLSFRGEAEIRVTPWYPEEADEPVATARVPVRVAHGDETIKHTIEVPDPSLWTPESPALYKVQVILRDQSGSLIDDYVLTTGIRTLSQEGGTFRLNGKPAMLNGAGIFGYRSPLDKLVTWQRSPPKEWLVREILMIKNGGGNAMRVHVHGWELPARNVNDPRLPELADQLGLMLVWGTPSWIRTGRGWGEIDFEGLPKYIRQVRNHPSIAVWEIANHTRSFKQRDYTESNAYVEKAYNTVYPLDPSRLISYNSFIQYLHYGNDQGTVNHEGDSIEPSVAWTAPKVTRGSQDSPTGYGKDWSVLREWPGEYRQNMLDSNERAYFNFEHEESISQPNWSLVKGKPWYRLHSYEWDYDKGSIGRRLRLDEWQESQGWQAFSAWESMKKQRMLGIDGFLWICLHGGPNTATYKKPFIDFLGHAKLSFWVNEMLFQDVVAGSDDVDVVYGPNDRVRPVVMNLGPGQTARLEILVKTLNGQTVDHRMYSDIQLTGGRSQTPLPPFRPTVPETGRYVIEYVVTY